MSSKRVQPERTPIKSPGYGVDDYTEKHPAYGMIGASRVNHMRGWSNRNGETLAGSDMDHSEYIIVRISPAQMSRSLGSDHWSTAGRLPYVEVALSYAQWATFLSTMNVGDGVPCTVTQYGSGADFVQVPGIEPIVNRREQVAREAVETLQDALRKLAALREKVTGPRQREIDLVVQEIEKNLPFVADQFDRHAEDVIEHAKIEVEAWMTGAIQRAGLAALGVSAPVMLPSGDGDTER